MKKLFPVLALSFFFASLSATEKPNIIFIMADDLGWSDLGCNGNDFIDTPHIDALAESGLRFTNFYAAGAVCSPTRCAVQSGQNQARIGVTAHIPGHWRPFETVIEPQTTMALPLETVTVAETLKTAGYATGYVGKWHLGTDAMFQPQHQGYDFSAIVNGPHLPGKFRSPNPDVPKPGPDQYRTDYEAQLSELFITENQEKPFFLMVSPFAVHIPLGAMSDKVEKYRAKAEASGRNLPHPVYAAMTEHLDDMVGEIVATVAEAGLSEKTLIVFTSDNGGLYKRYDYVAEADDLVMSNAPFRGEKGQLFEGGIRVPLIAAMPGLVTPGSVSDAITISYDFYPTFAELGGAALPVNQTIDGQSLVPRFEKPDEVPARAVHFHYPHYHHDRPASAIREGNWKLIEYLDGSKEKLLFDLAADPGEKSDLSTEKKGRLVDLHKKLSRWRVSVNARIPIVNPSYNPERAHEWWNLRTGEPVDSASRKRFPPTEKDL